jgi:hypothetical protein
MDTRLDQRLSGLLSLDLDASEAWSPTDLRQMVRHQMRSPLMVDLSPGDSGDPSHHQGIESFDNLFTADAPPLDLLVLTKNFAKASLGSTNGALPPEIAHLLYYLSIATARVRVGKSISTLSRDELIAGLVWCLDQPWLDDATRDAVGGCLALV